MKKQINKNVFIIASENNKTARDKFSPVATGEIKSSFKLNKKGNKIILTSLNYKNTAKSGVDRYNYKFPNKTYSITKNGKKITIVAGKNSGKFQWFSKSHDEVSKKFDLKKGVVV